MLLGLLAHNFDGWALALTALAPALAFGRAVIAALAFAVRSHVVHLAVALSSGARTTPRMEGWW